MDITNQNGNKFILHIGAQKTASTYLQSQIFPQFIGEYLGKEYPSNSYIPPLIFKDITKDIKLGLYLSQNSEITSRRKKQIEDLISQSTEKLFLYSNEDLCGRTYDVLFEDRFKAAVNYLANIFENPIIIFAVRNQVDWLRSMFYQMVVRKGIPIQFDRFVKDFKILEGKACNWLQRYQYLQEKFGNSAIHLIFYEELKNNREKFLHDLRKVIMPESSNYFISNNIETKNNASDWQLTNKDMYPIYGHIIEKAWLFPPSSLRYSILKNDKFIFKMSKWHCQKSTYKDPKDFNDLSQKIFETYRGDNQKLDMMVETDLKSHYYY